MLSLSFLYNYVRNLFVFKWFGFVKFKFVLRVFNEIMGVFCDFYLKLFRMNILKMLYSV